MNDSESFLQQATPERLVLDRAELIVRMAEAEVTGVLRLDDRVYFVVGEPEEPRKP